MSVKAGLISEGRVVETVMGLADWRAMKFYPKGN